MSRELIPREFVPHRYVQADPDSNRILELEAERSQEYISEKDEEDNLGLELEESDSETKLLVESLERMKDEYNKLKDAYLALKSDAEKRGETELLTAPQAHPVPREVADKQIETMFPDEDHSSDPPVSILENLDPFLVSLEAQISETKARYIQHLLNPNARQADKARLLKLVKALPTIPRSKPSSLVSQATDRLTAKYESLESAWDAIDKLNKGKISFGDLCPVLRKVGFRGDIKELWMNLAGKQGGVLSKDKCMATGPARKAEMFLGALGSTGDLKTRWNTYFHTCTGLVNRQQFLKRAAQFIRLDDAYEAFDGLDDGDTGLVCWADINKVSRKGSIKERAVVTLAMKANLLRNMIAECGSVTRAWSSYFGSEEIIGNYSAFDRFVKSFGFKSNTKELWKICGGSEIQPVKLEAFDPELSEALCTFRENLSNGGWIKIDKEGQIAIGLDRWILRARQMSLGIADSVLKTVFDFLDVESSGFLWEEDFDPNYFKRASSSDGKRKDVLDGYKFASAACEAAAKANGWRKEEVQVSEVGLVDRFRAFLVNRFGNVVAAFVQAFDASGSGLISMPIFLGAARGCGWQGRVKSIWSIGFGATRDQLIDLKTFSYRSGLSDRSGSITDTIGEQVAVIQRFYLNVRKMHGSMSRAWRLIIDALSTGYIDESTFTRICSSGELCQEIKAEDAKLVFRTLDSRMTGKLTRQNLSGAEK